MREVNKKKKISLSVEFQFPCFDFKVVSMCESERVKIEREKVLKSTWIFINEFFLLFFFEECEKNFKKKNKEKLKEKILKKNKKI